MKFLQKVWNDIRQGENIDLYLTVLAAIGLSALNILGIAPNIWVAPLTLAVLGLLAIATLGNRYRTEEVLEKLTQRPNSVFIEEYPPTLKRDIESSTSLILVGVTLGRTVKTYYSEFERKLRKGDSIKILLVNPNGTAIEMADSRAYWQIDIERSRTEIRGTLTDLCHLKEIAPDRMEVHVIEYPLSYGAVLVNPESASGILYMEHYPYKVRESIPKYVLHARDGEWYDFFKSEIFKQWEHSIEWQCSQL